jgi:DNA transformation protein
MRDGSFKDFVLDQLNTLGLVECRAMFGGYGLYSGRRFFGIIYKGRLYFKTTSATVPTYRARGMKPFRPNARQTLKTYYEVPVEVLEDSDTLAEWARSAIEARLTPTQR